MIEPCLQIQQIAFVRFFIIRTILDNLEREKLLDRELEIARNLGESILR
jgi:hypothetical protein